jgi:predicted permease
MIEPLLQDLRYGFRTLKKRPAFTLAVVLVMAAGIGANTAIFSVVDAFLPRPLPYQQAERLVRVQSEFASKELSVSYLDYLDWREQGGSFEDLAFFNASWLANVNFNGETEALPGVLATANLFTVLKVKPFIGRAFEPADDLPGSPEVVILSYDLWQRRYGSDSNVLGQALATDAGSLTVIGVMPRGFKFPSQFDMWVAASRWFDKEHRGVRIDKVIARLKAGVTIEQARADMSLISNRLAAQYPETNAGVGSVVTSERELWVGDVRPSLLLILSARGFVLLIACANVANLLLARAGAREREIAIRTALGARPRDVLLMVVGEGMAMIAGGAAIGIIGAFVVTGLLASQLYGVEATDTSSFAVAALLLTGVALAASYIPARRATKVDPVVALRHE